MDSRYEAQSFLTAYQPEKKRDKLQNVKRMACIISLLLAFRWAGAVEFFVSTDGNDQWSGRLSSPNKNKTDGPFATLDAARNALRGIKLSEGGATVWLRKGTYRRSIPLILEFRDSGSTATPITYAAYPNEVVRVCGSKPVRSWSPVTDEKTKSRLSKDARGSVLQANLSDQGFTRDEMGTFDARGFGRPLSPSHAELFVDDSPAKLAQFPNSGWLPITGSTEPTKFNYESDRPTHWADPSDLVVHGYWTWDWADSYERVDSIDTAHSEITTLPPHGVYGYKKDGRFKFLNVLEELDQPGEYYIDRKAMILYYWPLKDKFNAELSTLSDPLVKVDHAGYLRFENLIFQNSRSNGLESSFCRSLLIKGCTFRNLGGYGAAIDGQDSGFTSCNIYNTGSGGILLGGGERKTLTPGKNFAINCDIHDTNNWERTYRPAISIAGVENHIANCRIHDLPHFAILMHGNNHIVEYNDIFNVCTETSDSGAIYIGRDFTEQGNVIQYNYIHDLGDYGDVQGVYLDDWASGMTVYGNILVNVGKGVQIGGGRDNTVENNVFVNGKPSVHVDARGIGWAKTYFDPKGDRTLFIRLNNMDYTKPPFSTQYPLLAKILDDEPAHPKRNTITKNISVGGKWLSLLNDLKADDVPVKKDNWNGGDPGFVDLLSRDFHIKPGTPASQLGFRALPLERIGLFKDVYRSWIPQVWFRKAQ
jgi:hypothetical protein